MPIFTEALFTGAKGGNNLNVHQRWMNKQNVAYTYNRKSFSHQKEWSSGDGGMAQVVTA
jgi:hypothetical protein